MADTIRSLVWFAIVATMAVFAIFVVLGDFATNSAENEGPVPVNDAVSSNVHHLSGILMVPLACDELSVQAEELSATEYVLAFQTWQDPSVACPATPTPRAFEAVASGPATGMHFTATLDGKGFPITIIPEQPLSP